MPAVTRGLARSAHIVGAALVAFGVLLLVAANWLDWRPFTRFGLLGVVYLAAAALAALLPRGRVPAALIMFAATGGWFALIGMTYQTGADPWTLFAWWAALTLPLAVAVRHDALWTPWVLVASTALPLWLVAVAPTGWGNGPSIRATVLAWGIAVAIALGMAVPQWLDAGRSPQRANASAAAPAQTRWAFRLAVLLAVALIVTHASIALAGSTQLGVYLLGLALIGAAVAGLAQMRPLDLLALTIAAIGLDVLLIVGLWRLFFAVSVDVDAGVFLIVALLSVGIVVGTMRVLREILARAAATVGTALPSITVPGAALGALGALFAALPFLAALSGLFGFLLTSHIGAVIVGAALTAGGVALASRQTDFGFAQMLGLLMLLTGSVLVAVGLHGVLPVRTIAVVMVGLAMVLAAVIPTRWISVLLGFGAAPTLAVAVTVPMEAWVQLGHPALVLPVLGLAVLGGGAWLAMRRADVRAALLVETDAAERIAAFALGWLAGTLATTLIAAGPTFLLGATSGLGGGVVPPTPATWLAPGRVVAVGLALVVMGVGLRARGRAVPGLDAALAIVGLVLVACIPPLAVPLMIAAMAVLMGHRALSVAAGVVALWCIGAFYYRLDFGLAQKGVLLAVLGLGLGAVAWLSTGRPRLSMGSIGQQVAPRTGLAAGLVVLSVATTTAAVGLSIRDNEAVLRAGRLVHIALVPVDPRSLTQGDFMALRFALPEVPQTLAEQWQLQAVGDVDDRGVVTLRRIEAAPAARTGAEIVVDLTYKRGWIVATDAFFFREGRARAFETAKFGTFRVAPDGRARLVGLTDEALTTLR